MGASVRGSCRPLVPTADSASTARTTSGGSVACSSTPSRGLSAAEAARLARADPPARVDGAAGTDNGSGTPTAVALREQLRHALDGFDDVGARSVLDRLLGSYPLESVLRDAVLPYLHELGERWAHAEASVAQEHFATALLRGRLLALARDWGRGQGPHALLACVLGDQHDLGLICFGLALRAHGWRITYLGADTPLLTLIDTADLLQPALVVVSATLPELAHSALGRLRELACVAPEIERHRTLAGCPQRQAPDDRSGGQPRIRDRTGILERCFTGLGMRVATRCRTP